MAWRAHLQNEMYWYNRYASKIIAKLSSKQTPASIAKWSMFIIGTSFCWYTTGFCIRPFVLFNLHKWLNKGYFINQQTFCWWYLHFFYCKWYWCFWTWVEQWSDEKYLCGPINGRCPSNQMFQSRLKRWYSLNELKNYSTQLFYLIIFLYSVANFKSI